MRKLALIILFIVLLFSTKVNSAVAYIDPEMDILNLQYHPSSNNANCYKCHTMKMLYHNCTECHGTTIPVTNQTDYTPPSPPVVKYDSATSQTIHSSYSNNTDACASCHTTHKAVGTNLLKWTDVTSCCIACHDGTMTSTYNVKGGTIGNTAAKTSGGMFGVTMTEPGLSYHNYNDITTTSAAPGGTQNNATRDNYGVWNTTFNCTACHEPHGLGGNSRILSPDPNGVALKDKVVGETLTAITPNVKYSSAKQNWLEGYIYTSVTNIYVGATGTTPVSTGYTINYITGEVTFSPALTGLNIVKADYVPGLIVKMQVTNKLAVNESVTYTSGMNKFCGACHPDYETSSQGATSGHTLTGVYRSAYRHGVGMVWNDNNRGTKVIEEGTLKFEGASGTTGTIICLTCHFAHGTDDDFINNGVTTDTAPDPVDGLRRSTALKRQVNMSLCQTCHQK